MVERSANAIRIDRRRFKRSQRSSLHQDSIVTDTTVHVGRLALDLETKAASWTLHMYT